ncbi:MAG: chloride channel protein [Chloroflexota bacterium]
MTTAQRDPAHSDTAQLLTSVSGAGTEAEEPEVTAAQPVHPYLHVVAVALIGAVGVLLWLVVFEQVSKLIWENDVVTQNRWLSLPIALGFSLIVGLLVKLKHAPTSLDESLLDSLSGDTSKIDWRALPINVATAWASLFSGAVLGPEGGIGGIASKIAAWYGDRVRLPEDLRPQLVFSTIASGYNGLIANPLFAGILGTEVIKDPALKARTLPANLIGGAIGFLVFFAAGSVGLQNFLHLPAQPPIVAMDIVWVLVMALAGVVLAVIAGALFRVSMTVFGRFKGREVERALVAGAIFGVVGMVAPILLFSGETQVQEVVADPGKYGPLMLLAMAVVKLGLLSIAFKSGFLGGPTFPAIFASVCVAEAVSALVPGVRIDVLIAGVMAGFLMVLFRAPFLVVLLTAVMLQASPEMIALIVLAVAAAMIVSPYLVAAVQARAAARQAARAKANAKPAGG